jgi:hypothetical protein
MKQFRILALALREPNCSHLRKELVKGTLPLPLLLSMDSEILMEESAFLSKMTEIRAPV